MIFMSNNRPPKRSNSRGISILVSSRPKSVDIPKLPQGNDLTRWKQDAGHETLRESLRNNASFKPETHKHPNIHRQQEESKNSGNQEIYAPSSNDDGTASFRKVYSYYEPAPKKARPLSAPLHSHHHHASFFAPHREQKPQLQIVNQAHLASNQEREESTSSTCCGLLKN
jgi:hypothetical protein